MGRIARSLLAAVALGGLAAGSTGCKATLKAVKRPEQAVVHKGRGALIEREGLGVILTGVAVQLVEGERLVGMRVELLNQSDRPVRLDLQDIILTGGDGLRRSPMDPGQFKRYADIAQGDPPPARAYRPVRVMVNVGYGGWHYGGPYRHYGPYRRYGPHRHYGPYRRYGSYWRYGPSYYYDYDDDYFIEEYYRRRERVARFVASLFKTRTVQPGFVDGGYVVFDYKLAKKEELTVDVTLHRLPTTQPATAPTSQPLQPTAAGPMFLRFYFKS